MMSTGICAHAVFSFFYLCVCAFFFSLLLTHRSLISFKPRKRRIRSSTQRRVTKWPQKRCRHPVHVITFVALFTFITDTQHGVLLTLPTFCSSSLLCRATALKLLWKDPSATLPLASVTGNAKAHNNNHLDSSLVMAQDWNDRDWHYIT